MMYYTSSPIRSEQRILINLPDHNNIYIVKAAAGSAAFLYVKKTCLNLSRFQLERQLPFGGLSDIN